MTTPMLPLGVSRPPTKTQPQRMIGRPGLEGGTTGFLSDELEPALRGRAGHLIYRKMAEGDPILAAVLLAINALIGAVDWRFDPVDDSPAATEQADWFKDAFFTKMAHPFRAVIDDAALMFVHGFSPLEFTLKRDDDGKVAPDRVQGRAPETVWSWGFDPLTGDATGFWQLATGYPSVFIPRSRLLLFRTTAVRNNPEGKSLLRPAYQSWLGKAALERAEGRLLHRAAGVVEVTVPSTYMSTSADATKKAVYARYVQIAQAMAEDRQGAFLGVSDTDDKGNPLFALRYITVDAGTRAGDLDKAITRKDQRMAASFLADFVLLGTSSAGSFALSADKTELLGVAVGGFLDRIRSELQTGLVDVIAGLNGLKSDEIPQLKHGDVEDRDLGKLGTFIKDLTTAGVQLFPDPALENALRGAADLPPRDEAAMRDDAVARALADVPPDQRDAVARLVNGGMTPADAKLQTQADAEADAPPEE